MLDKNIISLACVIKYCHQVFIRDASLVRLREYIIVCLTVGSTGYAQLLRWLRSAFPRPVQFGS